MSNYPNGQPYYNYNQTSQYGAPAQGQSGLHRTSSFDAGDDARFFDQPQAPPGANAQYQHYSPSTQQPSYGAAGGQQSTLPVRSGTQSYTIGGYQHQYQPPQSLNTQYNPAQYQHQQQQQHQQPQQAQYNPQSYGSPTTPYQNTPYQPYIPAAYHDASLNRQGSMAQHQYNSPTQSYGQPPTLPPRPAEYTSQTGAYQHQHQQRAQSYYSQPYGDYAVSPYSPSSPPAPPPPPHQDAYNSTRPYTHNYNSTQESAAPASSYTIANLAAQPSPNIDRHYSGASRVSAQSSSFANSPQPSIPTPPSRNPSHHSPQRSNTLDRHPTGRTLPGVPSESESDNDYFNTQRAGSGVSPGYADLMGHLDAAISDTGSSRNERPHGQGGDSLFENGPGLDPDERPTHLNGVVTTGSHNINYGAFSNESDAEAEAGLAALQAFDEQEAAEESRRQSGQLHPNTASRIGASWSDPSDDSDYAGYDLGLAGGGFGGNVSYGGEQFSHYTQASMPPTDDQNMLNPRMDSVRSTGVSSDGRASQISGVESISVTDYNSSAVPIRTDLARVDTDGTGGLTEPSTHPRRLSYEEGEEVDDFAYAAGSPSNDIPDLFFHPGMSPNRPLPPPPSHSDPGRIPYLVSTGSTAHQTRYSQYEQSGHLSAGDSSIYTTRTPSPALSVPRSTSLASTRYAPKPDQPTRSKTDADRQKFVKQQASGRPFDNIYEISSPTGAVGLDLPSIPRKKFNPGKISTDQYRKCAEPWALSSILSWVRDLAEEETDLKEQAVADSITALFTHKVPTMNTTEAEVLGIKVVQQMFDVGALVREEEWVKFGPGDISGVLYQLTGIGCYSPRLHLEYMKGRCYSHHCMRTLKKVDLSLPTEKKSDDWSTYYKLKKDDMEGREKKEIERQNVLHEIVTSEETFISTLDVLRNVYRDPLQRAQPPIMPVKKLPGFVSEVFGLVDKVKKVNEDFLLAQLKYRQIEQGPWIVGFSDIFREWIRRARAVYVDYASAHPRADYLARREQERNLLFKQFSDQASADPRTGRLGLDNFLKAPITRLQRYGLLLQTVQKLMVKDSEEKTNLAFALDEVRAATFECNAKVEEFQKKIQLLELANKLKLRKSMEVVELNLDHLGRQVILSDDLHRAGGRGFGLVDTKAILFDHYLVLAKPVVTRDSAAGVKQEFYDVSKTPIPMDLISVESTNDPPSVKSSVKGIATMTNVAPRGQAAADPRLQRTQSTASGSTLQHTNTGLSSNSGNTNQSLVPSTIIDQSLKDDKILYPFRIKHLGKGEVYTLFTQTPERRQEWCDAIISAKENHAEALYSQNAEPFKLRVLADTAFGYEGYQGSGRRILIRGTPLHRAVQEAEKRYSGSGRPGPVCRAAVNCATVFQQPYGRFMCAIGTDFGVYISEYNNPRGWVRAIQINRVTQVAVLEEFNLLLLIADKVLIAYHLDVVCPASGPPIPQNDSSMRKAPQKLSGAKDVGFFYTGKMKDRALVFYKKKDGINSTFKVLEPILQKAATSRSRFLPSSSRRGQTDFFREYDEFYIPAECYGINVFNTTVAISTARGVEVLILDKKQPWSVPNLRSDTADTQEHLSSIATRIKDLRPLGMFRLSEAEFLVTFENCGVYVNKHGDVSRGVVMEFVGKAKAACLHEQYLILCDEDFVEIRDAQNGRLKQVIAGKEMRLLDDGGNVMPGQNNPSEAIASLGGGLNGLGMQMAGVKKTVKLSMQHPEYEKSFVIVELVLCDEKN